MHLRKEAVPRASREAMFDVQEVSTPISSISTIME